MALEANALWGITDKKVAEEVVPGVYALRGWGIASSFAIEAPGGWIIVDTGDSTRAAAEMREMLERTLGKKIKVAAILLTHWHYADGTGAWLDAGTELWGHEHLDRNRRASTGVSVLSGLYQARAMAQFGVFHPPHGPGRLPEPARVHPGEAPRRVELPAAHAALRERQGPRPRDRRRARPGRAQSLGRVRQRRLLLPPSPPARDEHHGDRDRLQRLHAPGRPVPRPGDLHRRRALDRVEERRGAPRHPRADPQGREGRAGGDRAVGRPGPAHPRPDPAPHRPGHGREGGGREPLHAAPHARRARDVRAGREPRPAGLQREPRLVRRGRLRDQSALAARGGRPDRRR